MDRIEERALTGLARGDQRRDETQRSGAWTEYQERVKGLVRRAFGPMPFGPCGGELNIRRVSSFDTDHCRIENVLFESFPGWEVNASVFVPYGTGPHPAIVIPVGHSGKQFENYQISAQAYASLGFVAVVFDPPGQSSEKQRGNDHFRDGVRSALVGLTPNRYFVLDALRCIDYLETRDDVDLSRGVAMTGVSGGGITTLYASLFDERIACIGPSCCLNSLADHPIGDYYSLCPESMWVGRLRDGVDNLDLALTIAPTPFLYMAGRNDEVFLIEPTRRLADRIADAYAAQEAAARFGFFEDDSGHAYTVAQVALFAQWVRRWVFHETDADLPQLNRDDFQMLDYEKLQCRPSQDVSMFTITRDIGHSLAASRSGERPAAERVVTVVGRPTQIQSWREGNETRLWSQGVQEAVCTVEGLETPMTIFRPWSPTRSSAALVWVDESGRGAAMEAGGSAFQAARVLDRDPEVHHPELYVLDPPGFGDGRPMVTPYQTAPWGSMDRFASYVSCGNADSALSIAVRTVATVIDSVARRTGMADRSIISCGSGLGGVVATLAAAISATECSICTMGSLASFQHLLEEEHYQWPAVTFLGNALSHFDLPDLLRSLNATREIIILNPQDGKRTGLSSEAASALFGQIDVLTNIDETAANQAVLRLVDRCSMT